MYVLVVLCIWVIRMKFLYDLPRNGSSANPINNFLVPRNYCSLGKLAQLYILVEKNRILTASCLASLAVCIH